MQVLFKFAPVFLGRLGGDGAIKDHHPVIKDILFAGFQYPFLMADGTELEKYILFSFVGVGGPHPHGFGMGLVFGMTQKENA